MKDPKKKSESFEEGLKRLEVIVEEMEKGDVPLETLVKKFDEGSQLLDYCNKALKGAELKIEALKQGAKEEVEAFKLEG